ncbi:MAG: isopropylmalate isomerase [Verrucomicrobiota bacterium]
MNFLKELRWEPTIGDPSFMGWFTVAAYAVAALLAGRVWLLSREKIWLFVAIGMVVLCVNKQLDLQSLVTAVGRVIAWHGGWFEDRRSYQKWIVLGILAVSAVLGAAFIWRFHPFWLRHKLLSAGVVFLLTFIVVRAVSFHHFDVFLNSDVSGVRMNWVLELSGIFLVALAAVREGTKKTK